MYNIWFKGIFLDPHPIEVFHEDFLSIMTIRKISFYQIFRLMMNETE